MAFLKEFPLCMTHEPTALMLLRGEIDTPRFWPVGVAPAASVTYIHTGNINFHPWIPWNTHRCTYPVSKYTLRVHQ